MLAAMTVSPLRGFLLLLLSFVWRHRCKVGTANAAGVEEMVGARCSVGSGIVDRGQAIKAEAYRNYTLYDMILGKLHHMISFYSRDAIASAGISCRRVSVCLFVCLLQVGVLHCKFFLGPNHHFQ